MSFSLWVTVKHAPPYKSDFDIVDGQTYNLVPMWRACGLIPEDESTQWLEGKTCLEMQEAASEALLDYVKHPEKYEALDPENGWGNHQGFFDRGLFPFFKLVHQHPTGVIHWSG